MRSIEVLDRNGARTATMPRIGPFKPIAQWMVQLIMSGEEPELDHQQIRKLYEQRAEANTVS